MNLKAYEKLRRLRWYAHSLGYVWLEKLIANKMNEALKGGK